MHTHFDDGDWKEAKRRYKESTALPASLVAPGLSKIRDEINKADDAPPTTPGPSLQEVIKQASISEEILSSAHQSILNQIDDANDLVEKVKSGKWSVEEVIESHLRMAAIAQQVLGCYSEIFFVKARERAKELDQRIKVGEDCGRLCGVPISIKAFMGYEETGTDRGFIFDVLNEETTKRLLEEEERTGAKSISKSTLKMLAVQGPHHLKLEAGHIQALLQEGAVIIAKTLMPQSVMQLDTKSNLHGQTLNPWNLHLSPGGSSGGDAASVSSGATLIGIGTDIGGSVRQPAAVTGLYGIRCTVGRIGIDAVRTTMPGNQGILSTVGPLCRSLRDLQLCTEIMITNTAKNNPFSTPPLPWRKKIKGIKNIRVGILRHDGVAQPITPIRRAMDLTIEKLNKMENVKLIYCEPKDYFKRAWDLTRELYFMDNGELIRALAKMTGEPLLPLTEYIISSSPVRDHTVSESWQTQLVRDNFKLEYWKEVWVKNELDVLLCPANQLCAPRFGEIRYWGYTSFFNLVDLPGAVFPVKACLVNSKIDKEYEEKNNLDGQNTPLSKYDKEARSEYETNRETFEGAPIALQLIGKRFHEEELLDALKMIDSVVNK